MTDMWAKVSRDAHRITELEIAKSDALGRLLGSVDSMLTYDENPSLRNAVTAEEVMQNLRRARDAYDAADTAYRNARKAK